MNGVSRRGFSLLELVVAVSIIGLLMAIIVPAVQSARAAARRTECKNKLRQVTFGCISFETSHRNFPSGLTATEGDQFRGMSWLARILPHVEKNDLWNRSRNEYAVGAHPFTHKTMQTHVELFACPSDPNAVGPHFTRNDFLVGTSNYLGVSGTNHETLDGVIYTNSKVRTGDLRDGASNTLLCGERPPSFDYWWGWWYSGDGIGGQTGVVDMTLGALEHVGDAPPADLLDCAADSWRFAAPTDYEDLCNALHFWSHHSGGAHFSFCDGSVRFLSYDAEDLIPALATRAGGEIVSLGDAN